MNAGPTFSQTPPASARERILDTARTLFYRRGVVNVGVDEVIAQSGVAKATLYKHFPSKDALILEFMRQGDGRWRAWLQERVEALEPDPTKRLLAVFDALAEWFALPHFRGCLLGNAVTEVADPTHAAHAALAEHKAGVRQYFEALAWDAGAPDPAALAATTLLLMEGATTVARLERTPDAAARAKAVLAGLLPTAAS